MTISETIRNWFWKGSAPLLDTFTAHDEKLADELAELKKLVRRQGIQQEALVRELSSKIEAIPATGSQTTDATAPDRLMEVVESFFHLGAALPLAAAGTNTLSAINIVWDKLDQLCRQSGLETIRQCGVPFDSRVHEAIDRAPETACPVVKAVTAPGFVLHGRVLKPARIALNDTILTADTPKGE